MGKETGKEQRGGLPDPGEQVLAKAPVRVIQTFRNLCEKIFEAVIRFQIVCLRSLSNAVTNRARSHERSECQYSGLQYL